MAHTFDELKKKTVAELREIAAGVEHEAVKGYSQLNKEHLLVALCKALNIEMLAHHKVAQGDIKLKLKLKIKDLKKARDEAVASGKSDVLKHVRRRIHFMKRNLRKAAVEV
jgi:histidinol phosphatase-like PHP family hydrolase